MIQGGCLKDAKLGEWAPGYKCKPLLRLLEELILFKLVTVIDNAALLLGVYFVLDIKYEESIKYNASLTSAFPFPSPISAIICKTCMLK